MTSKRLECLAVSFAVLVANGWLASLMNAQSSQRHETDPAEAIAAIGQDIAKLKPKFPQLGQFSPADHVHPDRLIIGYSFHTHRSHLPGGWRAQVPNPDDDGVWFHINFRDPGSTAQIDTQPSQDPRMTQCFQDKQLTFLVLEGEKTKPVSSAILQILRQHGVKSCNEMLRHP